jgi:NAD-dependent SIR2 family protein deacetylase
MRSISKTSRRWHGMRIYLYCQRCGKRLPNKPVVVNFQVLTRLCRHCYTYGGEIGCDGNSENRLMMPTVSGKRSP